MERTQRSEGASLSAVRVGEVVRICALGGGREVVSRLASLGFTPGTRLRVVQNHSHGPILVSLRDTRVALGRGEAERIVVERWPGGADGD